MGFSTTPEAVLKELRQFKEEMYTHVQNYNKLVESLTTAGILEVEPVEEDEEVGLEQVALFFPTLNVAYRLVGNAVTAAESLSQALETPFWVASSPRPMADKGKSPREQILSALKERHEYNLRCVDIHPCVARGLYEEYRVAVVRATDHWFTLPKEELTRLVRIVRGATVDATNGRLYLLYGTSGAVTVDVYGDEVARMEEFLSRHAMGPWHQDHGLGTFSRGLRAAIFYDNSISLDVAERGLLPLSNAGKQAGDCLVHICQSVPYIYTPEDAERIG